MKKLITALAAAGCLLPSAHAAVYRLDFTASNIVSTDGSTGLHDTIAGAILFARPSSPDGLPDIRAIDLTIGGHTYTAGEIAAQPRAGGYAFGARVAGVEELASGRDDFYLFVLGRYEGFGYTVSGVEGDWTTRTVSASLVEVNEVSEPGGLALVLAGTGALAGIMWRRRRP